MKVLRVGPPSGRARHQRVLLDGGLALRVRADDVTALGLEPGAELDDDALIVLRRRADAAAAMESALRLLAVRLRSRREVEDRLRRRGHSAGVIEAVLTRLIADGLLDDLRFSRSWVEGRMALRPSGALRLRRELRAKGVAPEMIEQVLRAALSESDERARAVEVATVRARRYGAAPPEVAYRRLAGVLQRRGFSAGAIAAALREVLGRSVPVVE